MDWMELIPVAVGGLIALAGGALAEVGSGLRARRAERVASDLRRDSREVELWELSTPAATRVREQFQSAIAASSPPSPWEPQPSPDFEDFFFEWWEDRELPLRNDIALIPDAAIRDSLAVASRAVAWGWALHRHAPLADSFRESVLATSEIGFEIASAWMRGERALDNELTARVAKLTDALRRMDDVLAAENSTN